MEAIRTEFRSIFSYTREIVARVDKRYTAEDLSNWDPAKLERDLALLKEAAFSDVTAETDPERSLGVMATTLLNLYKHFERESKGREDADARLDAAVDAIRTALAEHPEAREVFADALLSSSCSLFFGGYPGYHVEREYHVTTNS